MPKTTNVQQFREENKSLALFPLSWLQSPTTIITEREKLISLIATAAIYAGIQTASLPAMVEAPHVYLVSYGALGVVGGAAAYFRAFQEGGAKGALANIKGTFTAQAALNRHGKIRAGLTLATVGCINLVASSIFPYASAVVNGAVSGYNSGKTAVLALLSFHEERAKKQTEGYQRFEATEEENSWRDIEAGLQYNNRLREEIVQQREKSRAEKNPNSDISWMEERIEEEEQRRAGLKTNSYDRSLTNPFGDPSLTDSFGLPPMRDDSMERPFESLFDANARGDSTLFPRDESLEFTERHRPDLLSPQQTLQSSMARSGSLYYTPSGSKSEEDEAFNSGSAAEK